MNYFIIDDDPSIRAMLADIVLDQNLGEVVGEAGDGIDIDNSLLINLKVDILLIDILMPERDGIETIKILSAFTGKIIMISQIESKELIGEAYTYGIEYYITKPINQLEVVNVLQKVNERIQLENSIKGIKKSLDLLNNHSRIQENPFKENNIYSSSQFVLSELGIIDEKGSHDLINILEFLYKHEKNTDSINYTFPSLKIIFLRVAEIKLGTKQQNYIQKEVKACEQRIRRAIHHALIHIASLGQVDYLNPTFEKYASKLFEYNQVTKQIQKLKKEGTIRSTHTRINTKKFIHALYIEVKRQLGL